MFILGDFVFAKVHGYRPWPARVLGRYGTVSKIEYKVFLYGNCNTARVSSSFICDFEKNKRRLGAKITTQNAAFRSAMRNMLKAFARPETDFEYYQALARLKDEAESCLAYEMLKPTTESDTDSEEEDFEHLQTSTKTPKKCKSKAKKQDSNRKAKTTKAKSSSETEQASPPAKKAEISMSLADDQSPDQAQAQNVLDIEMEKGNAYLKDFAGSILRALEEQLKNMEEQLKYLG